jgi:hypothetical protein
MTRSTVSRLKKKLGANNDKVEVVYPRGPPSLMYNGYRVFPGGKVRPVRTADHSPPSSAVYMQE